MQGETESSPYYYQNLGEAEYVVALYSYMRLLGYPADKISILTTYNGQKDLIKDVVKRRCGGHPLLGYPAKVRLPLSVPLLRLLCFHSVGCARHRNTCV